MFEAKTISSTVFYIVSEAIVTNEIEIATLPMMAPQTIELSQPLMAPEIFDSVPSSISTEPSNELIYKINCHTGHLVSVIS